MVRAGRPDDISPRLWEASKDELRDKMAEMAEHMHRYEALKAGEVREIEVTSLLDIPEVLIAARIAAGLTQKQLAERLEVREQQVQHDEATRYAGASLERLHTIAFALGLELSGRVRVPGRGELPEIPSLDDLLGPVAVRSANGKPAETRRGTTTRPNGQAGAADRAQERLEERGARHGGPRRRV